MGRRSSASSAPPTSERSPRHARSRACRPPCAAMTPQLPLEMQLLLGRGLVVGRGICWQQPACTGGAVARAGGSPCIPRPPALYLHCPCSLPTASGPCAPLPIHHSVPTVAWRQALGVPGRWWWWLGTLGGGWGSFPGQQGHQVLVWDLQTPVLSHRQANWCFAKAAVPLGEVGPQCSPGDSSSPRLGQG